MSNEWSQSIVESTILSTRQISETIRVLEESIQLHVKDDLSFGEPISSRSDLVQKDCLRLSDWCEQNLASDPAARSFIWIRFAYNCEPAENGNLYSFYMAGSTNYSPEKLSVDGMLEEYPGGDIPKFYSETMSEVSKYVFRILKPFNAHHSIMKYMRLKADTLNIIEICLLGLFSKYVMLNRSEELSRGLAIRFIGVGLEDYILLGAVGKNGVKLRSPGMHACDFHY